MKTQISGEIRKQEGEIEAILRNLVGFTPGSCLHDSHDWANESRKQETTVWILIALLGLLITVALYILWFRTGDSMLSPAAAKCSKRIHDQIVHVRALLDTSAFPSIVVMKETAEHFDRLVHNE